MAGNVWAEIDVARALLRAGGRDGESALVTPTACAGALSGLLAALARVGEMPGVDAADLPGAWEALAAAGLLPAPSPTRKAALVALRAAAVGYVVGADPGAAPGSGPDGCLALIAEVLVRLDDMRRECPFPETEEWTSPG